MPIPLVDNIIVTYAALAYSRHTLSLRPMQSWHMLVVREPDKSLLKRSRCHGRDIH
jgi:hypothetical protein